MSNPSTKYNSDSYAPAWEDDGTDEISPEFAAVCSSDDGFSCGGNENDGILKLLKEFNL